MLLKTLKTSKVKVRSYESIKDSDKQINKFVLDLFGKSWSANKVLKSLLEYLKPKYPPPKVAPTANALPAVEKGASASSALQILLSGEYGLYPDITLPTY